MRPVLQQTFQSELRFANSNLDPRSDQFQRNLRQKTDRSAAHSLRKAVRRDSHSFDSMSCHQVQIATLAIQRVNGDSWGEAKKYGPTFVFPLSLARKVERNVIVDGNLTRWHSHYKRMVERTNSLPNELFRRISRALKTRAAGYFTRRRTARTFLQKPSGGGLGQPGVPFEQLAP